MALLSTHGSVLAAVALLGVVAMNVAATILLKFDTTPEMASARLLGLFGWPVIAGVMCYAVALVLYAWSLRYVDLHVAQIVVSLQFGGAILASAFIFHESIGLNQWTGISLIFLGLLVALK